VRSHDTNPSPTRRRRATYLVIGLLLVTFKPTAVAASDDSVFQASAMRYLTERNTQLIDQAPLEAPTIASTAQ
jgi:hypothetical protein